MEISLVELCNRIPKVLVPHDRSAISNLHISAVHVSELADPSPYLEGGELLLTTGIPLQNLEGKAQAADRWESYVQRLSAIGVAALGLGLGEGFDEPPVELLRACEARGLPLLTIPTRAPFLDVSREFWRLSTRGGEQELLAGLGTQAQLARLAGEGQPYRALVKALAQALGGWAIFLPSAAGQPSFWPHSIEPMVEPLSAEIAVLYARSPHSTATFALHGSDVVVYPIPYSGGVSGFLCVGTERRLTRANRQIIHSVSALLTLTADHSAELRAERGVFGSTVVQLLLRRELLAAGLVNELADLGPLPQRVYLAAVSSARTEAVRYLPGLLERHGQDELSVLSDPVLYATPFHGNTLILIPVRSGTGDPSPACGRTRSRLPSTYSPDSPDHPFPSAAIIGPMPVTEISDRALPAYAALSGLPGGSLVFPEDSPYDEWAETLAKESKIQLLETVRSYLRLRGRWTEVARELDLHRNTVRYRIGQAERLLGVELDDPDVAAHLWIALKNHHDAS